MKIFYIAAVALISFVMLAFSYQQKSLVGKWETKNSDGSIFGAIFKTDHTYVGYTNKKVFVSGNYDFKDDLLSIDDQICPDKGTYKVTFFSDSIRFSVIADSCTGRRRGTDRLVLGLVKSQ